jgi:hypothetical protein
MPPNNRVTYHGINSGILTSRNPLAWERGSPLGMNSRPRDAEDTIVFDALDDIIGLADLGAIPDVPLRAGYVGSVPDVPLRVGRVDGLPNPFATVSNIASAPKMIAMGAVGGLVIGCIFGFMLGRR